MRFITSAILALAAISSTVFAQSLNPNAITKPDGSVPLKAGETTEITWVPSTSPGTITLRLRKGPSTSLSKGDIIAAGIANGGSFSWAIPKDTPAGTDYAITITDDTGAVPENFTPLLTIISDAVEKSTTTSDTATSDTTTTTSGPVTGYTTGTHTKPHNSTMTTITGRNSTTAITGSSNATMTISGASETSASETTEETSEETPTSTGTQSGASEPSSTSTSGAISLLNSPLALVVCVLGAVFYLN